MMEAILVPAGLWSEGDTAVIGSWLYADGETVAKDVVVAEIMVEKTSYEVAAPASGTLRIGIAEEAEVQPGNVIGHIDV